VGACGATGARALKTTQVPRYYYRAERVNLWLKATRAPSQRRHMSCRLTVCNWFGNWARLSGLAVCRHDELGTLRETVHGMTVPSLAHQDNGTD
jgi:hypothetical protein